MHGAQITAFSSDTKVLGNETRARLPVSFAKRQPVQLLSNCLRSDTMTHSLFASYIQQKRDH